MLNKDDAVAARELILEILTPNKKRTANEIALQLNLTGRSVGQLLRELVVEGKAFKYGLNSGKIGYTSQRKKVSLPKEKTGNTLSERFLIVWKEDDTWKAEVISNNTAGLKRAAVVAGDNPGSTILCGKAEHRVSTPKPKVRIENL